MQEYEVIYHKILADNVKKYRKQIRLSQEKLTKILECSREFISRVENNHEKLSLKMILKLSYFFKISPSEFFKP